MCGPQARAALVALSLGTSSRHQQPTAARPTVCCHCLSPVHIYRHPSHHLRLPLIKTCIILYPLVTLIVLVGMAVEYSIRKLM